jgi:spore coat polysaccharide biosynthesis protein SpsF
MNLSLRKAAMEDALDILKWRNDEKSREGSFNKETINIPQHLEWYKKKIADENCLMFILMEDGHKAGNIRLDIKDNIAERSYMIAPEHRGRGLGKEILHLLEQDLPESIKALAGFTLPENAGSRKCFEDNGYTQLTAGDVICYLKVIS